MSLVATRFAPSPTGPLHIGGVVTQIFNWLFTKNNKGVILAVTPEGTRKKVTKWKTGFLRIAQSAQCKVLPLGIDYPSKTFNFGKLFDPTGNNEKDVIALQMSLKDYKGRHPERH